MIRSLCRQHGNWYNYCPYHLALYVRISATTYSSYTRRKGDIILHLWRFSIQFQTESAVDNWRSIASVMLASLIISCNFATYRLVRCDGGCSRRFTSVAFSTRSWSRESNMHWQINAANNTIGLVGAPVAKHISFWKCVCFQVGDSGAISEIPIVPTKALFLGNSLLLGSSTFGTAFSAIAIMTISSTWPIKYCLKIRRL